MNKQNKLAIVIPYYKIDFFEKTIQSIASQSNKNFALYIGNDASSENPLPIIKKHFTPEKYHYFEYTNNLGGKNLALQWERVLENVKEDWFQILGDDDTISENFVEEFYKNLHTAEDKSISVIKFSHQWINDRDEILEDFNYPFKEISATDFFIKKYNNEIRSSLSENIFKRSFYLQYKFEKLPLAWGSDDLAILSFSDFKKILYVNSTKVKVRISEASISGSESNLEEKLKADHELKRILIIKYADRFNYQFIDSVIESYLYHCYIKNYNLDARIIFYYLRKLKPIKFLKALKQIYYIRKKHAS
ncbi:Glycosyl transferase family 2 [Chryseobacterium arachidis]|uniref:Glycosyl transferase family 2 n=1 Tax=Chryseobacterium arachidis TaxID=1416778 RepID=A0A1M4XFP6_9FLAO|nr:glycosyltransferase [Chryseobacterium arachidis]SHE92002.1 Glycosyl transferase family 2 [Chryseobacterium arachidis]